MKTNNKRWWWINISFSNIPRSGFSSSFSSDMRVCVFQTSADLACFTNQRKHGKQSTRSTLAFAKRLAVPHASFGVTPDGGRNKYRCWGQALSEKKKNIYERKYHQKSVILEVVAQMNQSVHGILVPGSRRNWIKVGQLVVSTHLTKCDRQIGSWNPKVRGTKIETSLKPTTSLGSFWNIRRYVGRYLLEPDNFHVSSTFFSRFSQFSGEGGIKHPAGFQPQTRKQWRDMRPL